MSKYDFSRRAAAVMNSPYWGDVPDSLDDRAAVAERNRRDAYRDGLEDWYTRNPEAASPDELPDDLRMYWDLAERAAERARTEADAFMRIFEDVTGEIEAATGEGVGEPGEELVDLVPAPPDFSDPTAEPAGPGGDEEVFLGVATGERYVPPVPPRRK